MLCICIAIILSIVSSSDTLNNTSMQNKSDFSQSDEQRISCSFSLMFDTSKLAELARKTRLHSSFAHPVNTVRCASLFSPMHHKQHVSELSARTSLILEKLLESMISLHSRTILLLISRYSFATARNSPLTEIIWNFLGQQKCSVTFYQPI